jgi:GT2 family glycosyltransferase
MMPRISIVILVYNNYEDTGECLNSLEKITYSNYEVILIDNGSTDGSVEKLKEEYPHHTFIFNKENLGFAGGVNTGIQHAIKQKADYVLLLGNDAIVDKGFLEPLVTEAENNPNTAIVGSKVYYYDRPNTINFAGGKVNLWRGGTLHIGSGENDTGQYEQLRREEYQDGCAMMIRASAIDKLGLFDTAFFLYYEEVDFCCRARQAGYEVMNVPQSKVRHKISLTVGGSESLVAIYHTTRSKFIFMRKYARLYHWLVFFPYFVYSVVRQMLKWTIKDREFSKLVPRVRALINGFKNGLAISVEKVAGK